MNKNKKAGLTLVEMIGVIAVIAILAAVSIPKILKHIQDSKIVATAKALDVARTEIMSYLKNHTLTEAHANLANRTCFGDILMDAGVAEKPFLVPIGFQFDVNVRNTAVDGARQPFTRIVMVDGAAFDAPLANAAVGAAVATAIAANNIGSVWNLNGLPTTTRNKKCFVAIIPQVTFHQAWQLAQAIDGHILAPGDVPAANKITGKVVYLDAGGQRGPACTTLGAETPQPPQGTTNVYILLALE